MENGPPPTMWTAPGGAAVSPRLPARAGFRHPPGHLAFCAPPSCPFPGDGPQPVALPSSVWVPETLVDGVVTRSRSASATTCRWPPLPAALSSPPGSPPPRKRTTHPDTRPPAWRPLQEAAGGALSWREATTPAAGPPAPLSRFRDARELPP